MARFGGDAFAIGNDEHAQMRPAMCEQEGGRPGVCDDPKGPSRITKSTPLEKKEAAIRQNMRHASWSNQTV